MRKFLMSSIVAALASCKPGKLLTGTYAHEAETPVVTLKDTLIVSRQGVNPDSLNIERRAAFSYKDGMLPRDTTIITKMNGRYDPKEKLIRTAEDDFIRVGPRRRVLQRAQWTYRRMGR